MVTFFVDRDDLMDFPLVGYGVCGHAQLIQGSKVGQQGMRTDLYQTGIDIVTSISFSSIERVNGIFNIFDIDCYGMELMRGCRQMFKGG